MPELPDLDSFRKALLARIVGATPLGSRAIAPSTSEGLEERRRETALG